MRASGSASCRVVTRSACAARRRADARITCVAFAAQIGLVKCRVCGSASACISFSVRSRRAELTRAIDGGVTVTAGTAVVSAIASGASLTRSTSETLEAGADTIRPEIAPATTRARNTYPVTVHLITNGACTTACTCITSWAVTSLAINRRSSSPVQAGHTARGGDIFVQSARITGGTAIP